MMVVSLSLETRNSSATSPIIHGLGTANVYWTSHSHQSPKRYPMSSSHWQLWAKDQKVSWIPGAQCYSVIQFVPLSLWVGEISSRFRVLSTETWCNCDLQRWNFVKLSHWMGESLWQSPGGFIRTRREATQGLTFLTCWDVAQGPC